MQISTGTLIRTIILALALVNQILVVMGKSPIPVSNAEMETLISTVVTIAAAIVAWWKNNSFTEAAIKGDQVMAELKVGK